MRRALALGSACVALAAAFAATLAAARARADSPPEAAFTETRAEAPVPGAEAILETRWQSARPPFGEHDRIGLHRYRAAGASRAALLYLPGTNMNGEVAVADERYDLWLYLAARGVEVFALDYRTHFVPNDDVDSPAALRFLLDWTLETFTEDAAAAAAFARATSGHERLFVAGFSRGVTFAFALACTDPAPFGGLVALDGPFKRQRRGESFDFAAARDELIQRGRWASDVAGRMGWQTRHALMSAAAADPDAPAQAEGFASVGDQVSHVLYGAWHPGALANPLDGFSRPQVLARLLAGYDRWWPAIQNVEGSSIGDYADDPRTRLDDRFGELAVPILYVGATGLGAEWVLDGVYTSVRSGSDDVTLRVLEGWGHLDVIVGERAETEVFAPVVAWIAARAAPPSDGD